MPHHPVAGDLRIRNFSIEPRLDPCRVRFLQRLGQRRRGPCKGLKRMPDSARGLAVPSRSHAAHIGQTARLAAREPQFQESARPFRDEADYGETPALPCFYLEPLFAAARAVGRLLLKANVDVAVADVKSLRVQWERADK